MLRAPCALPLLLALLAACNRDRPSQAPEETALAGAAASVNGEPIALGEVERLVYATGTTPRQALAMLVAERLLAQHAEERGYAQSAPVQRELERARVRALLEAEIEGGSGPSGVADRQRRLGAWLSELQKRVGVEYRERVIARALSELEPPPLP